MTCELIYFPIHNMSRTNEVCYIPLKVLPIPFVVIFSLINLKKLNSSSNNLKQLKLNV